MRVALEAAREGAAHGEVPVGCVAVRDEEVVARAHNEVERRNDATAHAESLVLEQLRLRTGERYFPDITLYVTLEPCIACTGLLLLHRVSRVVYGTADHKWGGCGSIIDATGETACPSALWVRSGILEDACREVLTTFFQQRRNDTGEVPKWS